MRSDMPRNPTRRDVLAMGLASAGALALGGRSFAADTPEPGPYGPFKMGIQSYSLRAFKYEEALAHTKDLGLHYWECYRNHISPKSDQGQVDDARLKAEAAGVKVIGFGVEPFTKDHDANKALFAFGKKMGLEYISSDPTPDAFDSLDKLVEEFGIPVGIHPHGPGHRWAMIDDIQEAIKDHDPKIGICLDTGHLLRAKQDPLRAVEVFEKRIYGVHLKDVKDAKTFTILGDGDLRVAELLKALAKQKYNHCLALEYEENEKSPDADLKACLAAVKKAAATL